MSNILQLTLTRKWFDMIESGEKTEEYRDIYKMKHGKKVLNWWFISRVATECKDDAYANNFRLWDYQKGGFRSFIWKKKEFVQFCNGYNPDSPVLLCDCEGIDIGEGREDWGAVPGVEYFRIHLSNPRR